VVEDCQQRRPDMTLRRVFMITGIGVHDPPESVFTIDWNLCSRSNGIRVHDPPESASKDPSVARHGLQGVHAEVMLRMASTNNRAFVAVWQAICGAAEDAGFRFHEAVSLLARPSPAEPQGIQVPLRQGERRAFRCGGRSPRGQNAQIHGHWAYQTASAGVVSGSTSAIASASSWMMTPSRNSR
jgi:hypothetical protein